MKTDINPGKAKDTNDIKNTKNDVDNKESSTTKNTLQSVNQKAPSALTASMRAAMAQPGEDVDIKSEENKTEDSAPRQIEDNLELRDLPFKERMKAKRQRLEKNMEGMDKKERRRYLIYYFKWPIIAFFGVIAVITMLSISIYKNKRPLALGYVIFNSENPDNINTDFLDDYREIYGLTKGYQVREYTDMYYDADKNSIESYYGMTTSMYTEFPTMCNSGMFDIIISDEAGIDYFGNLEVITPLENYFSDEIYSMIDSDSIYYTENFDGETVGFAIDISDTEFAKNLNLDYEKVYLGFPGSSDENYDNALRMLEYIYGDDFYQE